MSDLLTVAQRWRARAEQTRRQAAELSFPDTQRVLTELAESYDRLAERAEEGALRIPRDLKRMSNGDGGSDDPNSSV